MGHGSSEPVDVLLTTLRFYPVYSGPGERFRRYAPGLRDRGVKLRVFSAAWIEEESGEDGSPDATGNAADKIGRMAPPVEADGIHVDRVFLSRAMGRESMLWTYFRALGRYLRGGSGRPDAVQLLDLSYWSIPFLFGARRRGIRTVHTVTMVRDPSVGRLKNFLYALPFRFLDRTVVSTGVMRESLRSLGVGDPIEVIPNGVDLHRFRPASDREEVERIRRELDLPADGEVVTFVGGYLQRRKGVDLLAEAWSSIAAERPDAWLVLVGPHHDALRPSGPRAEFLAEVDRSLERSGARDRVIFTGKVNNVEAYLRASDVFVFPSRREGMPNVVPEAFASGLASVLTPFVGLPDEFGQPGREYLLADESSESLARHVLELLENPGIRREMGRRAREWVRAHLGLESSLDQYAHLYRTLANSGAASSPER